MFAAIVIAFLALVFAAVVVIVAGRRHQNETGESTTWAGVKEAFASGSLRDARHEAAMLAEPDVLENDLRVADLLTDISEEGSGYVEPRDLLSLRPGRD